MPDASRAKSRRAHPNVVRWTEDSDSDSNSVRLCPRTRRANRPDARASPPPHLGGTVRRCSRTVRTVWRRGQTRCRADREVRRCTRRRPGYASADHMNNWSLVQMFISSPLSSSGPSRWLLSKPRPEGWSCPKGWLGPRLRGIEAGMKRATQFRPYRRIHERWTRRCSVQGLVRAQYRDHLASYRRRRVWPLFIRSISRVPSDPSNWDIGGYVQRGPRRI
jgi:hypothetical protein